MINSFVLSLGIPVMINILCKMIRILHEKILNAIYLYYFHDDTVEENNSLNGQSNEPFINAYLSIKILLKAGFTQ